MQGLGWGEDVNEDRRQRMRLASRCDKADSRGFAIYESPFRFVSPDPGYNFAISPVHHWHWPQLSDS